MVYRTYLWLSVEDGLLLFTHIIEADIIQSAVLHRKKKLYMFSLPPPSLRPNEKMPPNNNLKNTMNDTFSSNAWTRKIVGSWINTQ